MKSLENLYYVMIEKKYWRREYFPNYKSNRKKDREKSGPDWNLIFETLNNIRDEIRDNFPIQSSRSRRCRGR